MNASAPLAGDREQIRRFVEALFRYPDEGSFVSLRAFYEDANEVYRIEVHALGAVHDRIIDAALALATRAAREKRPVVVAPPVATFLTDRGAAEVDLQNGLALSVECDAAPVQARQTLEFLLGPATIVVASGGEWVNPDTGEVEDKVHLHWRLRQPTRDAASHAKLKRCRTLAKALVGADGTSAPMVHPMRWPGTWHRKGAPRLTRIVAEADVDLDLDEAEERLLDARRGRQGEPGLPPTRAASEGAVGKERRTDELIAEILTGSDYHAPAAALAMRFLKGGMVDAQVVLTLRGIFTAVPEAIRDIKDGVHQEARWQARYDDLPRAVRTARAKIGTEESSATADDEFSADGIKRFRLDGMTDGPPPAQAFLLPRLMPLGKVGLLFGPGGIGKSLVAMALCLAVATRSRSSGTSANGFSILGADVPLEAAGASVFLTLEDDVAEIHRRVATLDPEGLRRAAPCFVIPAVDLPDFDPALVVAEGRIAALTAFAQTGLDRVLTSAASAAGCPVRLLVLDPAGDFLNADENDATFVKLLMRHLRAVSARHGCTIILIGHVAKGIDVDAPTMRGSSAWIANSRFAYALWPPLPKVAEELAKKVHQPATSLVLGKLIKANHADAPVGALQLFSRQMLSGHLKDMTRRLAGEGMNDTELLTILVDACAESAAAGMPFSYSGIAGLWNQRTDLPEAISTLSKPRMEKLGTAALALRVLVKTRTTFTQGTPNYLDVPEGPLALGKVVEMFQGSRAEAIKQYRACRSQR
ncbi:MAG: hypothetical protein JWO24_4165 [Rhodospirillales bacterium]|nr:hypothetical protein [Rhodospirillales bacterium]